MPHGGQAPHQDGAQTTKAGLKTAEMGLRHPQRGLDTQDKAQMPRKDSDPWDRDHIPEMGLKTPKMRLRPPQDRGQTSGTVLNPPQVGTQTPQDRASSTLEEPKPPIPDPRSTEPALGLSPTTLNPSRPHAGPWVTGAPPLHPDPSSHTWHGPGWLWSPAAPSLCRPPSRPCRC